MGERLADGAGNQSCHDVTALARPASGLRQFFGVLGVSGDVCASARYLHAPSNDDKNLSLLTALLEWSGDSNSGEIASALLHRFGSLSAVLFADAQTRERYLTDAPAVAAILASVSAATAHALAADVADSVILADRRLLDTYLRSSLAARTAEQFRVLFLNSANRLIADEVMSLGNLTAVTVDPREIVKRSLEFGAAALILVHNHPSGNPAPSQADIIVTRRVVAACRTLGITVHDHLIVARSGIASFRELGLL